MTGSALWERAGLPRYQGRSGQGWGEKRGWLRASLSPPPPSPLLSDLHRSNGAVVTRLGQILDGISTLVNIPRVSQQSFCFLTSLFREISSQFQGYGSVIRSNYCWHLGNERLDLEEHSFRLLTFVSRLVGNWEGN